MMAISGATTALMREQVEGACMKELTLKEQAFDDVLKKVQHSHYPLTVNWSKSSVDRTVAKWVSAALQRLRKKGKVEFIRGGKWRLSGKNGAKT